MEFEIKGRCLKINAQWQINIGQETMLVTWFSAGILVNMNLRLHFHISSIVHVEGKSKHSNSRRARNVGVGKAIQQVNFMTDRFTEHKNVMKLPDKEQIISCI
ncbi:hypothetical protein ABZP36_025459 [Zizania latifolia]